MDQRAIPPARARHLALPQLPLRLHHHAFVVRDQEANRRFFEDVLGLPLVATWCEKWLAGDHAPNNTDRKPATAAKI